mgnify:CR=1 FL=1
MVEIGGQPAASRVAIVAVVVARDVRWVFAGRGNAVVAGSTGAKHLRVVHGIRRYECTCVMAVFANIRRLNMRY